MELSERAQEQFSTDEEGNTFVLGEVLESLGETAALVAPALGVDFDLAAITRVTGQISASPGSNVTSAVTGAAAAGAGLIAQIPGVDDALGPLLRVVELTERLASEDAGNLLQRLRDTGRTADANRAMGAEGLAQSLSAVFALRRDPAVGGVVGEGLALIPGGATLDQVIERVISGGEGVKAWLDGVGGLMALKTLTTEIDRTSRHLATFLKRSRADELLVKARSAAAQHREISARLAAADPDNPKLVEEIALKVGNFVVATRELSDELVLGMARAEATLVDARLELVVGESGVALRRLDGTRTDSLRALTLDVKSRVEPFIPTSLPFPAVSLEQFWNEHAVSLVDTVTDQVSRFAVDRISQPIAQAIDQVTGLVRELNRVLGEVVATVRSAFEVARQVVASIDVRSIAEAIRAFLAPVVSAIQELERILGTAMTAFEDATDEVVEQIGTIRTALQGVATTVGAAFDRVAAEIDSLNIDQLVEDLRGGVEQAVGALDRVQLRPYFDTAVEVTDTTARVVDAIPLDLLPDDTKRELSDKIRPIKEIDFDAEVRQPLRTQMDTILDELDDTVLAELTAAFDRLKTFLDTINPRTHLTTFERDHFDPMLERIRAVDPDELLRPVTDAIEMVRQRIVDLDIREQVLGAIERVFDEILARFDQLNPAALVAPIEARVDAVRARILELTGIDQWAARVNEISTQATNLLDQLDLGALIPRLDAFFDDFLASASGSTGNVVGGLVATLASGAGFRVDASAYPDVARWLGGDDGASELRAVLGAAVTRIEEARALVAEQDLRALSAELGSAHRAIAAAVRAHPAGSLLRQQIEPMLASAVPDEMLGAVSGNQPRCLARFDEALAAVRGLAQSGLSQVTATSQGLRDAMRPLSALADRALGLLRQFGIDAVGKDVRTVVRETFDFLRPSRALAPLVALVNAVKAKLRSFLIDGIVAPVQRGIAEIVTAVNAIDVSFIREELEALHAAVRAELVAFRPTELLSDILAAVDELKARLVDYDPLAPIRTTIRTMQQAADEIGQAFRPTVLFASILATYDEIVAIVQGLDVRNVLEPVLNELRDLEEQLDEGLGRTGEALGRLQEALP